MNTRFRIVGVSGEDEDFMGRNIREVPKTFFIVLLVVYGLLTVF